MKSRLLQMALVASGSSTAAAGLYAQPLDTSIAPPAELPPTASKASQGNTKSPLSYKGGFTLSEAHNKLTIQGRLQSRFHVESVDTGTDRETKSAFSIPRARITIKGKAHSERLSYKFQSDFGKGSVALKDFYVDYRLGSGELRLRSGQFKKPFSRQQLNSSSKLEFVDRSIVDKAFGNGRDIGIELHNNLGKSPGFEWALGIFNGSGDKGRFSGEVIVDPTTGEGSVSGAKFSNVPSKIRPALVARIGHNQGGIKGYSEADLEGGPLRYSLGAAAMIHFGGGGANTVATAGADLVVKLHGLSASGGTYVAEEGATQSDLSYRGLGTYAQLGYVIDKRWQPALRYALLTEETGDTTHEVAVGVSVYQFAHNFKWQNDVALLRENADGSSTNDLRARSQLQLTF